MKSQYVLSYFYKSFTALFISRNFSRQQLAFRKQISSVPVRLLAIWRDELTVLTFLQMFKYLRSWWKWFIGVPPSDVLWIINAHERKSFLWKLDLSPWLGKPWNSWCLDYLKRHLYLKKWDFHSYLNEVKFYQIHNMTPLTNLVSPAEEERGEEETTRTFKS